jgi:PAS domain S-box-containing protein
MREKLAQTLTRASARVADIERNDVLGGLVGFSMLAALVTADVAYGPEVVLAGTFVVVPFVTALWAGIPLTAVVGLTTITACLLSGIWNDNFGQTDYDARAAVVVLGAALAVAGAWTRERARRAAERLVLLDEVGAVADGSLPLDRTLARVIEVIVPGFADFCMVDAIHDHRVIRSAVRVHGWPDGEDAAMERRLAARHPGMPDWMVRPHAPFPRQPRFIPRFNDEDLRRLAQGDLDWLRSLGLRSSITVAMLARDRMLGALTLNTAWSGRRYTRDDVRFAQALASRVAMALDNAGLFSDLESVERRMDTVMSILDEGIVIYDAQGELVFANPAAMELMGFDPTGPGGQNPTSWSTQSVQERFDLRAEDGTRLTPEELAGRRALSGEPAELVVRAIPRDGGRERWLITRAKPIMGPDGPLYSVTAIEDVTSVKRAEFRQGVLARVGDVLATAGGRGEMAQAFAEQLVPSFADWCIVEVPAPDGRIEPLAMAHADADKATELAHRRRGAALHVYDEDGAGGVLRRNEPTLQGEIMVPMSSAGRSVGVVRLGNEPGGRSFDEDHLSLATELAWRLAAAMENARLALETSEVARILQEGLKPPALPHMPGWESAAMYQPAGEVNAVGGDFYDAFEVEGGWMVTVGDVVGKGATAASLTALARHTIRTAGLLTGDPRRALELLDAELRTRGEGALCTAAILVLPASYEDPCPVSFVSAGHPLPLLLRSGRVEEVGEPGPLLGAFEGAEWVPASVSLRFGDQLVLYTDGVVEARGRDDRFGDERLREELAGAESPLAAIRRVSRALEGFIGGEPEDDVALIAVRREAIAHRPPSRAEGLPEGRRGPVPAS